jgi:hypothetical protein
VYALASCTASIFRGSTVDEYGDDKPNNGPTGRVATGVMAAIVEHDSSVWDQATSTPRVVRMVEGRVQSNIDVRIGDRIRDDSNNDWFWVENVTRLRAGGRVPDTLLQLRRVT